MRLFGNSAFLLIFAPVLLAFVLLASAAHAADTVTSEGGNVFKVIDEETEEGEAAAEEPAASDEPAASEAPAAEEAAEESEPATDTAASEEPAAVAPAAEEEPEIAAPAEPAITSGSVGSGSETSSGPGRIQLSAVIAAGAPPMDDNIAYKIERLEFGAPKEVVASHTGPDADVNVPNGRYRVTAVYGEVVAQEDIQVNGELQHQVNLNAGWIILRMIPHVGGDPLSGPIDWQILTFAKNYKGERSVLRDVRGVPTTTVVLPAGWYMVHAVDSGELTKHAIEVTPGATVKYTLVKQ